jgi:hypothetical protein
MNTPIQSTPDRRSAGSDTVSGLAGRYLTFRLGAGSYGVQVSSVREIVRLLPITAVPQMPPSMRGVVNLRERVIPVVDMRQHFGQGSVEAGNRTCIVVVETQASGGGLRQPVSSSTPWRKSWTSRHGDTAPSTLADGPTRAISSDSPGEGRCEGAARCRRVLAAASCRREAA